jgi:hypothetical protein
VLPVALARQVKPTLQLTRLVFPQLLSVAQQG